MITVSDLPKIISSLLAEVLPGWAEAGALKSIS